MVTESEFAAKYEAESEQYFRERGIPSDLPPGYVRPDGATGKGGSPPLDPARAVPVQDTPLAEPQPFGEQPLEREADSGPEFVRDSSVYIPPQIPSYMNNAWAAAITTATQNPEAYTSLQETFARNGKSEIWEQYKRQWLRSEDQKLADTVVENTIKKAQSLGYQAPTKQMFLDEVKRSTTELITKAANADIAATATGSINWDFPDDTTQDKAIRKDGEYSIMDTINREANANYEVNQQIYNEVTERYKDASPLAQAAITMLPESEQTFAFAVAKAVGMDFNPLDPQFALGEFKQRLKTFVDNADPDTKLRMYEDLKKQVFENPLFFTDYLKLWYGQYLFDPAAPWGASPTVKYDEVDAGMDTIFAGLDSALFLTGVARTLGKGVFKLGANPVLRTINTTNKEQTLRTLAAIVNEPEASANETWNITKAQVAIGDMPKPAGLSDTVDDVPSDVVEEAQRIQAIQEDIQTISARGRASIYTDTERQTALEREKAHLVEATGGRIRLGLSTIVEHEDGGGVTFLVTMGRNNKYGWRSATNALRMADKLLEKGVKDVEVWSSNGDKLSRFYNNPDEIRRTLWLIDQGFSKPMEGNFYVRFRKDYFYNPSDKLIFGESQAFKSFQKGFDSAKYLLDNRTIFDEETIYKPALSGLFTEAAIASKMQALANPLLKLSRQIRRNIGSYYAEIETWARKNGNRYPSKGELHEMFPAMTDEEFRGLQLETSYWDTFHWLQNDRLYRDRAAKGFVTLGQNGSDVAYHGAPLDLRGASRIANVFDPVTGEAIQLRGAKLKELYDAGGYVLRADRPIIGKGNDSYSSFIYDPRNKATWDVRPLDYNQVKKIVGYYPRMYKDTYYIYKINPKGTVDGELGTGKLINVDNEVVNYRGRMEVIATAPTRKEAERWMAARRAEGDGYGWGILQDRRLSEGDKINVDMDLMQTEGRLFFDDRNVNPLTSVRGGYADIEDPINLLERTSRIVGRQIGNEELNRALRESFQKTYMDMVGDITFKRFSEVEKTLEELAKGGSVRASKALELWRYIRVLEGVQNEAARAFKRLNVASAEFIDKVAPMNGVGRSVAETVLKGADKWTPDQAIKSLAHLYFIRMRPIRQLLVQGAQHLSQQLFDPTYAIRWQKDSIGLQLAIINRNSVLAGEKSMLKLNKHYSRRLLNLDEKDFETLIREYDIAAQRAIVDIHSFAGDLPLRSRHTPETRLGDVGDTINTAAGFIPRAAQRIGFDAGEQFTRAASYMMSLRLFMKRNGIKKISDITKREQWQEIALRADDYAFSMHRVNNFKYQRGWLAVPTQFLSFTHKTFISGLKAVSNKYGSAAFTRSEAIRMLAGQVILYGAAGLGIKELMDWGLKKAGLGKYIGTPVADVLYSGAFDWIVDTTIQKLNDDPDLNLAIDETFAPGANMLNTMQRFYEAAVELSVVDGLLMTAPGVVAGSRIWQAVQSGWVFLTADPEIYTPSERALATIEALSTGAGAGFSDAWRVRAWRKLQGDITKSGTPQAYAPKMAELYARGLMGIPTQQELDRYSIIKDYKTEWDDVKRDAEKYYELINYSLAGFAPGTFDDDKARAEKLNQLVRFRDAYSDDPLKKQYFTAVYLDKMLNQRGSQVSAGAYIAQALYDGKPPLEYMKYEIRKIVKDPKELADLELFIDNATTDYLQGAEQERLNVLAEEEAMKERANAN